MSLDWRTLPSLSSLRAFDATARHGGFSGAARVLNVTHAAVAQQVRALEKELGVRLVVRAGRAVSLTDEGNLLALSLGTGFTTVANGIDDLRKRQSRRGLRVSTTTFIVDSMILPRLSEFWADHPEIEVALQPSPHVVDIVREGYDLAIRAGNGDWPGMESELLAQTRTIIAGAPTLIADGAPDPLSLPWISFEGHPWERELLKSAGVDPKDLHCVSIGSPHLELAAARQGLGLIVAREIIVRDDLAAGRLREVPFLTLPETGYYAVMPKGPRPESVRLFALWLKKIFA